jgi:hypothetical protein
VVVQRSGVDQPVKVMMKCYAGVAAGAFIALAPFATASAQDTAAAQASAAPPPEEAQALAKQLSNPIAALISVPLQSNYDWGLGPNGVGWQYKLNIQPVIPVPLNADWNLISRTIVPVIDQGSAAPGHNVQAGLGDTVQSIFFSPQKATAGGLIWGVGPVALLPTATENLLGSRHWGLGPTAVVLRQQGPWTVGMLANHIWSVAGERDRPAVNATFIQPFLGYTTSQATTFTVNMENTYDWTGKQWTAPLNLMVAQLLKPTSGGLPFPIQVQVGYRYYFAKPQGGPKQGVRLNLVALFPR